jgi:phosphate transport system substrate-binding protein
MAEDFMDMDPDISIAVTGGGSGTGISALLNGRATVANASRAMSEAELELARDKNIDPVGIIFGVDAICFIVNENNPITGLTTDQIREIFTGRMTNWTEGGGDDYKITLYGRAGNSGTFSYIQKNILKENYSLKMKQMSGNSQIIEGIRQDPAGIGYVGIGYAVKKDGNVMKGLKVLSIQAEGQDSPVTPVDFENISNGSYALVRPLYQFMDGRPAGKLKEFLLYELGEKGQKTLVENGFFPISENYMEHNNSILQE